MSRLPALNAKRLSRMLKVLGFKPIRQRGSHIFFRHPDGRTTVVPFHAGEDLDRTLVHHILREIGSTPEEFSKYV